MGQIYGKARIHNHSKPFINLPNRSVVALLEATSLIAESYGLTIVEVKEIFQISFSEELRPVGLTNLQFQKNVELFYHLFDRDHVDVVDTFEFLSTIILTSDTPRKQKIKMIFRLFDIEEKDELSQNEIIILIHACASGLCKISELTCPTSAQLTKVALTAFDQSVITLGF